MMPNHVADAFPLSPMQQGMLFNYLREPHSGIDIEQLVVHLPEAVDIRRLQAAWEWLADRHEMLRARFVWEDATQPRQEIVARVSIPFLFDDARALSEPEQRERLAAFLDADRRRGFELNAAPLFRLSLFEWSETSFTLVWTFHHALLDGRSYPALLREVFEAGEELASGPIAPRPEPPSFRRYIDWLGRQDFTASEAFWKEYLKGFSAPTPLVVDKQTASDAETPGRGEAWHTLASALTGQLHCLARAEGLTVNSIVMGAWAVLLHRYSGEEEIVFGATRACRKSTVPDADQTIGIFINTVPVHVRLQPDDSIVSVLRNVRRMWLEMRPHEHLPLARIKAVSQVAPARPLFETLVVFENYRLDRAMQSLGGAWSAREVELHELTNFPITLAAYDGEELSFKIHFDQARIDGDAVRRLLGHLAKLLEGAVTNPRAAVSEIPVLTDAEREELLARSNSPAADTALPRKSAATLHEIFEAQVSRNPSAIALTCDGQSLTYAQLNARANRIARRLVESGVRPDTLVGLCLDRSNELVTALMAILKAGGAYLSIDLAYPADRVAFMLEDAQAPVLLTERKLAADLPVTRARVLCVDEILAQPYAGPDEEANLPSLAGPDDLAYVIYTSGTTGRPKGSLITHANVTRLFHATEHWYGFDHRDVWTLFHSCAFDFSVWEIWGALLCGGRVVVVPFVVSRSPEAFYELLASEQVTVLNQTPSAFRQLIQAEEAVGQKQLALRYVIFGGEALEMRSLQPWFERHGDRMPRLVNMYGITETTVHVTYRPLSKDDLTSGSVIGTPIPDLRVYILDARRQPVPVGVPGEMYVAGAGLARGYLYRPELTAERFVPDHLTGRPGSRLYKTGDLARFLPGGDIEYLGRIDDQVKIRGFRIELGEIESLLTRHPSIRESKVIAREDTPGTKRLVAYLVVRGLTPDTNELRTYLKSKLPDYMTPAAFVFLDKLPLTASGKIDRKALPAPQAERPDLAARYVAPRSASEKILAAVWAKVLRVARPGINDNFFELGGDSILSIQMISLARREGLNLTPKQLFANQTIAELAAVAGEVTTSASSHETVSGDVPLTPIQRWFFEQDLQEVHHYNQAFLFEVGEKLDRASFERALNEVSRQHDALRLRCIREANGWHQFYSPSDHAPSLTWVDLASLDESAQRRHIETAAATMQASLDLENGPIWRIAYFNLGSARSGRLLVIVHHIAVDGISWRPLLEDLETAYRQLRAAQPVALPPKTTSFKTWAERLSGWAHSEAAAKDLEWWQSVVASASSKDSWEFADTDESPSDDTEGSAATLQLALSRNETDALLHLVPSAYNTRINDTLLTALARAWAACNGSHSLFTNLEGHGRENLFDDVDLSRTAGWFTSIFPVRLELPATGEQWQPGEALKSVKEQLRRIPRQGISYGVLRYLAPDSGLSAMPEPRMVFNYLGQFDQVLAGSKMLRFAPESAGPWHSPKQVRCHALEINAMVIQGSLEVSWTFRRGPRREAHVRRLANEFQKALNELIVHCQSPRAGGRTPSDFPLARLDQPELDRLLFTCPDMEDVYPLSPIQTLFYSLNPAADHSAFDQWRCTLRGNLNVPAFQRAWQETLRRHTILRSTIHGDACREPVQIVHKDARLRWTVDDWRHSPPECQAERWSSLLAEDRSKPIALTHAAAMRFTLIQFADETWKFLWSVPALLLDGWSWPLVFRDASRLYREFAGGRSAELAPVRPYRDYLEWLRTQSSAGPEEFWRASLAGFREPTPLHFGSAEPETPEAVPDGGRYLRYAVQLSAAATDALQSTARRLQITVNALLQGAWALLLNRQCDRSDIVFGAAFSGRPADLNGSDGIVGPFVNNLPVRLTVDRRTGSAAFFRQVHSRLLELSAYQFTPLVEIQRCSEMPWRNRLFDSLVVFQNYLVDESARRFGADIEL
ncbi:MAG TPA: amino acid adenylation domain-containing protein, partial [Bryobacteraceae bacterium]|nr:amino acid adenylation domain-containing protein [Bryobacteraceae bacterium]